MVIDIEGEENSKKKFEIPLADFNAKASEEQERKERRKLYDELGVLDGARSYLVKNFMQYHCKKEYNPQGIVTWQELLDNHPVIQRQDATDLQDISTPEHWQALIEFGLEEETEKLMDVFKTVGLRKIKDYPLVKIKDLGTEYAEKLVAVQAPVIGISALMPDDSCVVFQCKNCKREWKTTECVSSDDKTGQSSCGARGASKFRAKIDPKKATDKQVIVLQDGPLTLSCVISGPKEYMWRVKPGQKAYCLGVLKFESIYNRHTRKDEMHPYLDLLYTEPGNNQEIEISHHDIARFKEMVQDPLFRQHLMASFAPHIKGNDDLREVCIYVLASQELMRPNNGALFGPPARGKSKFLHYCSRLSHKGVMQSFGRVSIPGLTAATVTDEHTGQKINKPGLFASYAFAGLNELQSIQDKKDLKISLNDVLDRKEATTATAGGDYNIEARCAVLIDSNNYMGLWDYRVRLAENLRFMEPNIGPFLSRMDLIAVVSENRTDDEEDEITDTIFDSYQQTDDAITQYQEDWETENGEPRYGFNTLRKFFYYVSQQPEAKVSQELKVHFREQCRLARKHDSELLIDGRYQESVMRQTRVGGRLFLKEWADKDDMDMAFTLVNRSKNIEVATEVFGEKDANPSRGLPSKSAMQAKMSPEEKLEEACRAVMEKTGKEYFEVLDVVEYIVEEQQLPGWSRSKVEQMIKQWWLEFSKVKPFGAEGSHKFMFDNRRQQRKLNNEDE